MLRSIFWVAIAVAVGLGLGVGASDVGASQSRLKEKSFLGIESLAGSLYVGAPMKKPTLHGPSLLSVNKLKTLPNGHHHVAFAHGHPLHAQVNKGKIQSLFLKSKDGKIHVAKARRVKTIASTLAPDGFEFVGQGGDMIQFTFSFTVNGTTITFSINFPTSMVQGGGDPTNPGGDPTNPGGDPTNPGGDQNGAGSGAAS